MISWPSFSLSSIDSERLRSDRGAFSCSSGVRRFSVEALEGVGDVEERVALEADLEESRLHSGEDPGHPSLVDVADDVTLGRPLDEELGEHPIFQECYACFLGRCADDDVFVHAGSLSRALGSRGPGRRPGRCSPGAGRRCAMCEWKSWGRPSEHVRAH